MIYFLIISNVFSLIACLFFYNGCLHGQRMYEETLDCWDKSVNRYIDLTGRLSEENRKLYDELKALKNEHSKQA